jgi:hypothetical protein
MVTLSLKADFSDVKKKLNALSSDLQKRVVPAALNKVIAKANTEMTRQITSEFNIKQQEVRSRLRITRAKRNYDRWFARLDPFASARAGRSLNLIRFVEKSVTLAERGRRKKNNTLQDLRFKIKRGDGAKIIKGAFIANNGRTVFVRVPGTTMASRSKYSGTKHAEQIKALSTIDVPQMFNTRRIQGVVLDRIKRDMVIEFDRAIKSAMSGFIR